MYELLNINTEIKKDFFDSINKTLKNKNWESILTVALKKTIHQQLPNFPFHALQNYMQKTLQPIYDQQKYNVHTREFLDGSEAIQVWHNTYNNLIAEIENSSNIEDKINLELIYCIYDLLEYDKVTVIDGKKYLHSFVNLNFHGTQYYEAYNLRVQLDNVKQGDKNIDIATNRGKTVQDRVKFLNPKIELELSNPKADTEKAEIQKSVIEGYCTNTRIMARCISGCSLLAKQQHDNLELSAIADLQPYLNSDEFIPFKKIYESWYALVKNIYMLSSDNSIPLSKVQKIAHLSSQYLFDKLQKLEEPIFSIDTMKKPIRERSLFDTLRLLEFTDNRIKIVRSHDEIIESEEFISLLTQHLNSLSKS